MELREPQHRVNTRREKFGAFIERMKSIRVAYVADDDGPATCHPDERVHLTDSALELIVNAAKADAESPAIIDPNVVRTKVEAASISLRNKDL
jgi:hypothetical protein